MVCIVSRLAPIDPIPPPPDPASLVAGDTYSDPTFGTTIMRATDETDGNDNKVAYSYWPTFNEDCSRLLVSTGSFPPLPSDNGPTLFAFDAETFALDHTSKTALSTALGGKTVQWEGATWSRFDPNILYACEGLRLWHCDVVTGSCTLAMDFTGDLNPDLEANELWQMSMSRDDTTFAFSLRDADEAVIGYVVWRAGQGILLQEHTPAPPACTAIDEVHIDKTGDFLVVAYEDGTVGMRVWDLRTDPPTVDEVPDGFPGYAPGHYDTGKDILVGHDDHQNRTTRRALADPLTIATVCDFGTDWTQDYHVSMLADDETKTLLSFYTSGATTPGVFHGEIVQASLDGVTVSRLAHHHAYGSDYWDEPHANISRDGRFVAYTSNWDNNGRRDVFVLRVPSL